MCQYCLCQVIPFLSTGGLGTNHSQPRHALCTRQCVSLPLRLRLCRPSFPSSSSALQVPARFASSSAVDVTRISHFLCPTPQKRPTPIPAARVTDVTLNTSGVRVRASLETVHSFMRPFCMFLVIHFSLDPIPLSPCSLVAYMYIPSISRPWARDRTLNCSPLIPPVPFLCPPHRYLRPLCLLKQARQRPQG